MARNDILNITDLDGFDSEGFNVPLDFKINDFRDLGSRQGTNSKTIFIPGTKKNDSIFSWRFQLDAEGFYDDNAATPVTVERENIRILQGSLQLFKVITKNDKVVEYECVIYSDNAEWFSSIEGDSIKDLTLGSHIWTSTAVEDSWVEDSRTLNFVYGLVDYGFFPDLSSTDNVPFERLRPSVYIMPMIRQIFKNAGFTFKSEFFDRAEYRDIAFLFTLDRLRMIPKGAFRAELTTSGKVLADGSAVFVTIVHDNDSTGANFDPDNAHVGATWTCPQDGDYILHSNTNVLNDSPPEFVPDINYTLRLTKNGVFISQSPGLTSIKESENTNNFFDVSTGVVSFVQGDTVNVQVRSITDNTPHSLIIKDGSYFWIEAKDTATENGEILLTDNIPDISQKDLIKWLFTQFNLVATTNNVTGEVVVEPRDKFYGGIDDAEDWSELVDYSQQIEFTKLTEGLGKKLNLHYKEDEKDDNLVLYRSETGVGLGDHTETLENEFLKGDKDLTNKIFASTFMGFSFTNTLYMPLLINAVELQILEDAVETEEFSEFEPRICYYNGLKAGDWRYDTVQQSEYPQMIFIKEDSRLKDVSLAFNNLSDVTDIQFLDVGLKDKLYNSLFNNINFGRLATLFLKLDPIDILTLDFRKLKFLNINGERKYFILNKIENYTTGPITTKTELIEVKPSQSVKQFE